MVAAPSIVAPPCSGTGSFRPRSNDFESIEERTLSVKARVYCDAWTIGFRMPFTATVKVAPAGWSETDVKLSPLCPSNTDTIGAWKLLASAPVSVMATPAGTEKEARSDVWQ